MTDKTRLTTSGLEGSMIYEYLAVPRHQGNFTVPPIEFTYFDTASKQYKTLTSESYELTIDKGEGGNSQVQSYGGTRKRFRCCPTTSVSSSWTM